VDGFEALGREQRSLKAFYTAGQSPPTCGCQLIINLPFGIGCLGSTLFRGGRALQAFGDAIAKVLEHPTFPRLNAQGDFAAKRERRPAPVGEPSTSKGQRTPTTHQSCQSRTLVHGTKSITCEKSVRPTFTVRPPIGKIGHPTDGFANLSSNRHQTKSATTRCYTTPIQHPPRA
jgi:hypothetical protein